MPPPSLGRLQAVAFVLVRHGFGEIVSRLGLGTLGVPTGANGPMSTATPASMSRERLGKRIARVLSDLGPTYIKLGQLMATREDLFAPEITSALRELHSAAPPLKPKVVMRLVSEALGRSPDVEFAWFDPSPLAAASIGQVHRARLHSGEDVVVKVQRPDLHRIVKGDLALMRMLAGLLAQAVPEIASYDPLALLDAFERSIEAELDFRREADNARRLATLLATAPEVRVPRIHSARPTLLVMEFVRGRPIVALDEPSRKAARGRLIRAFVRQILEHGVFHADPHPGNFLVEDSGRVVLLDLGAVEEVDGKLRRMLGRVVLAMALQRHRALGAAVVDIAVGGTRPTLDRPRLEGELAQLVKDTSKGADGAQLLGQMVSISRTHELRMPPALLGLARAIAILDGVLRSLDPAADLVADVRREFAWSMMRMVMQAFLRVFVLRIAWMIATMSRGATWGAMVATRARGRLLPRGAARSSMAD